MFLANIFTLYPEIFPGVLGQGIYHRAMEKKLWKLDIVNIRDYALDKHSTVDDKPFGGGSGMVMKADVIDNCLEKNSNNLKTFYLNDCDTKAQCSPSFTDMNANKRANILNH